MSESLKFYNIGKCYKIKRGKEKQNLWALRNFTLDVEPGEIVGLVGSNGAGKSTILKICSRVVQPTEGTVEIFGRYGALLEVGTGFHPEFTGMENIYFNGAILGISRKEIDGKIDDIIKFAGIEKFIDTPVKRYSSGMYTRLAFAIAAQLDVENMFIDEVLAVGDAEFQRKCLAKMGSMAKSGRTILFVSHDMTAITRLCTSAVWLDNGTMQKIGEPNDVVQEYISHTVPRGDVNTVNTMLSLLPEDPTIKITGIKIMQTGNQSDIYFRDYPIDIEVLYTVLQREPGLRILIKVLDDRGNLVMRSYHDTKESVVMDPGKYTSKMTIPGFILAHKDYEIGVSALVFNQRTCTGNIGEGVRIPIRIESISSIDSYPEEAYGYRPNIEIPIEWKTVQS